MSRRLPTIDETRKPSRPARPGATLRSLYLPPKQAHFTDISPEEIERRYQQRIAELKYLRLLGRHPLPNDGLMGLETDAR